MAEVEKAEVHLNDGRRSLIYFEQCGVSVMNIILT